MSTGWLHPLVTGLLGWFKDGMPDAPAGAFVSSGYAHLPLPHRDGQGLYLRLAFGSVWTTWSITSTSVVLNLAGTIDLEMYLDPEDALEGKPQYARSFGPEEAFAAHVGTLCALQNYQDTMQVLVMRQPEAVPVTTLTFHERTALAQRAQRTLERAAGDGR
ncbi:hypothetical protein ACFT38_28455 [Streptomyces sp. NPDC056975]|uniref:hypothetical protein n=1 Tax=Streptomyces sp. NPDC056975 TaxID=3345985 RepID=UPI003631C1AB